LLQNCSFSISRNSEQRALKKMEQEMARIPSNGIHKSEP
jgi:hypothetical protein